MSEESLSFQVALELQMIKIMQMEMVTGVVITHLGIMLVMIAR
jgi:hypothetical protein